MTSDGSPYTRLQRAIRAGNLPIIRATVRELGHIGLPEALGILVVIEAEEEDRFDAAARRWLGRLALETPDLELRELATAVAAVDALPDERAQRTLLGLARRPRPLHRREASVGF